METADEPGDGEYHPAPNDWPKGFGEASWWPIVVVAGVVGLYVGAGLYVVGRSSGGPVGPIGLVVALVAFGLFVAGAGGWLYQAFVGDYWDRPSHVGGRSLVAGMVLFLASDVATFGALFTYYFVVRLGGVWPSVELPPGLLGVILLVNTLALLASSGTYYWGERRLAAGDRRGFLMGTGATVLLGLVFLVGQVVEYYGFVVREGFTPMSGLYGSAFFGLTGLHVLHVTLGVVLLSTVLARGVVGQYSADRHVSVTTVGWYWHFVDAVWLVLVASVYLGSQVG